MSIRKNTWNLNSKYDLTNSGWDGYFLDLEIPSELFAVGDNDSYGGLGQNDIITRSSPVQIPGTQWIGLASGRSSDKLAWKNDNTLWAWGRNTYGGLGLNNVVDYSSPTQIPGTEWKHTIYAIGGETSKASLKTDGTLWTWGSNYRGQLGVNDIINYSSPIQVPGTQWSKSFAGADKFAGIKTDGTLWVWGRNNYGGLGINSSEFGRSSPYQLPGTEWKQVSASFYWMMGTKTDGTLWAWGRMQGGCLGQNEASTHRSSPTQIPGTQWEVCQTDIYNATAGAGVKTDGTLWVWGYADGGMLGQNSLVQYSSPQQIPGTGWTTRIAVGQNNMTCTKTDGTLWGWGQNSDGQLGLNEPDTGRSSPVQIAGTDWQMSIIDSYNLLALKA